MRQVERAATEGAITPTSNAGLTVSTSTSTGGQRTYTVTGITSANTPTGQINIALFPSTGADAPAHTGGTWTFTSSGGSGHAGIACGQANSDNQGNDSCGNGSGTTPASPTQGSACVGTSSCYAYIVNLNGTPTTNAPDQVSGVNAASGGTVTFIVDSFQLDDTIPVVFSTPTAGQTALQVSANGQPASGYPFAVGGDTSWGPNAAAAPSGTYHGWYVFSVNTSAGTFVACNTLPPGSSATCYTFTMHSGDTYTYPAQNGGWNNNDNTVNLTMPQFQADLSGPLTGLLVPTDGGPPCTSTNWAINNAPGDGTPTILCTAGTGSNNSNNSANPDVVDVSVGSPSTFSYANFLNGEPGGTNPCSSPPASTPVSTCVSNQDAPAAPTGLTGSAAVAGSAATVTLNWNGVPNQDVSQDTTNAGSGAQAEYDVYRSTVTGGVPGTFSFIGTNFPATGPPATTFTDNAANDPGSPPQGNTTYQYAIVAVSSDEAGGIDSQIAGPASSTFQVTTPGALAAAPQPQVPTTPVSMTTTVIPKGCPSACTNASGSLGTGDTFQVVFNTNISVASGATFTLTEANTGGTADGTEGTLTCGTTGNANCSTSANVLSVTLTGLPVITHAGAGPDGTLDYGNADNSLTFTAETGVSNTAGNWNLPWSGSNLEGSNWCVFDTPDPNTCAGGVTTLPGYPTASEKSLEDNSPPASGEGTASEDNGSVLHPRLFPAQIQGAYAGSTSLTVFSYTYPGTLTSGATITAYDTNGNSLGSGTVPNQITCSGSACNTSIPLSTALVPGEILQVVWKNAYSGTANGTADQGSDTLNIPITWAMSTPTSSEVYGEFQQPQAIFLLATVFNSLGDSQTVPVTVGSHLANSTVWLTFYANTGGSQACAKNASATVGSTALSTTPQLFQTDGSGNVTVMYTTASCAHEATGSFEDVLSAASDNTANPYLQTYGVYLFGTQPPQPTVSAVSPSAGTANDIVNITGTNFVSSPAMTVVFCTDSTCSGTATATATYISPTQLQVTTPTDPGGAPNTVGILVCDNNYSPNGGPVGGTNNCSDADGDPGTDSSPTWDTFGPGPSAGYTYGTPTVSGITGAQTNNGAPTPVACDPVCGPSDGGNGQGAAYTPAGEITITGLGFDNVTSLSVGATTVSLVCGLTPTPGCFTIVNDTTIHLDPPAGDPGAGDVDNAILATNADGQGTGSGNLYEYYGLALVSVSFLDNTTDTPAMLDNGDTIVTQYNEAIDPSTPECSTVGGSGTGISLTCLDGTSNVVGSEGTMGWFNSTLPNTFGSTALSHNNSTFTFTVTSGGGAYTVVSGTSPTFTPNTTDGNTVGVDDTSGFDHNEDAAGVASAGND